MSFTPTKQQFEAFENAYQYFNKALFKKELPDVILNLSRKNSAMGFVAPFRWRKADDEKGSVHELSINPSILSMSAIDVYSTLVHEQAHIWQYTHGTPSRNGYHNKQFANKMIEVGLMPSTTGRPGGNKTGQRMSDYPIPAGIFLQALEKMPERFKLPFVSTESDVKSTYPQLLLDAVSAVVKNTDIEYPCSVSGLIEQVQNFEALGSEESTILLGILNNLNHDLELEDPQDFYEVIIGELRQKGTKKKNKSKYTCQCNNNVWGKPDLNIICGACEARFEEVG